MKKQSLITLAIACAISAHAFTMDTIVMNANYEPMPLIATEVIVPELVITKAYQNRAVRLTQHRYRLTEFATFLATLETTIRDRRERNRRWLEAHE